MRIDEEFAALIPPLTAEEYRVLEASILADGCRDALVIWNDVLVDGHNRYRICTEHGVPYKVVEKEFADRNEVLLWMLRNQLGRRNLNDFQRVEMVRKCEGAVKTQAKERQLAGLIQNTTIKENFPEREDVSPVPLKSAQRDIPLISAGCCSRDVLARMAGVGHSTYEHATAVLDNAPDEVKQAVRKDELSINAAYEVTKLPQEQQQEVSERIAQGEKPQDVVADVRKPHVAYNSGNNEWYTPSEYIELAREVMGGIDLDPASCECANEVVQAKGYYTAETDGLAQDWFGNVWLNPPYSTELIAKFSEKLIKELPQLEAAIVLVNNATETEWFFKLVSSARAVCFPNGRVKFYRPDGTTGAPLQGQVVLYYGEYPERFIDVFRSKGWCALPQ